MSGRGTQARTPRAEFETDEDEGVGDAGRGKGERKERADPFRRSSVPLRSRSRCKVKSGAECERVVRPVLV